MRAMDRRTFMVTGGLALAGLATACKKKPTTLGSGSTLEQLVADVRTRDTAIQQIQAVEQILVGPRSRVAFALISPDNTTQYKGGSVKVWWSPIGSNAPARGPVPAVFHGEGLGDKGVYVARINVDQATNWNVLAVGTPNGLSKEAWAGAAYPSVTHVAGPGPGGKAISVPTPTVSDHRGVNPYCTRTPPCAMHQLSLDKALANGKPTVFVIGTPRFCTSRVCGPVVDVLQTVMGGFAGRVNFVHAEVYLNDTDAPAKQILAPAPKAWSLENEPVVYWIKPDNTIIERIVGPTDIPEVRDLTQSLLA